MLSTFGARYTEAVTVFYELSGDGAQERLTAFGRTLTKLGWTVEVLENTVQPGLFLLFCRGQGETRLPDDAPTGAKLWQFRSVL